MTTDWTDLELEYSAGGEPTVHGRLPGHPEWKITATFAHQNGQLVVSSCSIAPAGDLPLGGLTARQLRRATLGDLTRRVSVGFVGRILGALAPEISRTLDDDHAHPRPGAPDATTTSMQSGPPATRNGLPTHRAPSPNSPTNTTAPRHASASTSQRHAVEDSSLRPARTKRWPAHRQGPRTARGLRRRIAQCPRIKSRETDSYFGAPRRPSREAAKSGQNRPAEPAHRTFRDPGNPFRGQPTPLDRTDFYRPDGGGGRAGAIGGRKPPRQAAQDRGSRGFGASSQSVRRGIGLAPVS